MNNDMLARRIRDVRERVGFTQEKVADTLGMSRQAYIRLEQGMRDVSFIEITKLAELFKVHYSVITDLGDDEEKEAKIFCRDEQSSAEIIDVFNKVESILGVFSAQEKLFYQMEDKRHAEVGRV